MILRLALIGFGNVGQEFARLLLDKREWLIRSKGLDIEVHSISTRSRGSLTSTKPIDLERALGLMKNEGHLRSYGPEITNLKPLELLSKSDADLMVELSPLNVESGQPARDHIRAAMEHGMDVITANKGPIAFAYGELRNLARSRGVHFRFEGTVMDGTPIFNLVERTLPGCEILGLTGILNSTSNFVLTQMSAGRSMDEAIREAQRKGFAETDPSLDIDGWDAAAKITALANVLMDAQADPTMVQRTGIRDVRIEDVREAASKGKKIKMIASARLVADGVKLTVSKELIGPDHPFWSVDGTSSALTIRTDLAGDLTIIESNPTVTQTAYAVFSDLLLIVDAIRSGTV
jgi:homoserine dehydrogenase